MGESWKDTIYRNRRPKHLNSFVSRELNKEFVPVLDFGTLDKPSMVHFPDFRVSSEARLEAAPGRKRLLIFDQCGDKTRLVFTSELGNSSPPFSYTANPSGSNFGLSLNHHYQLDQDVNTVSDEDTDELDALLYCDDSEEEDEVRSTGHSPYAPQPHNQNCYEDNSISVSSWDVDIKRRKLNCEQYGCFKSESNTSKKDEICRAVCILQRIMPAWEDKKATSVIDEAILYLQSLKKEVEDGKLKL